ncbi:MAG TPA: acetate--CoA ligase family protein [Smithellaceae bacterium]|nr:acetate--CoA ligase family protein [Smithellaceae bacterium]
MTEKTDDIISKARAQNRKTLSEYESATLLTCAGMPMVRGIVAGNLTDVKKAAQTIGYPVVLKACAAEISHKTENGLVVLNLISERDLEAAYQKIRASASFKNGEFLVQEMIKGSRELAVGMIRDAQFGPCVMFGLGGIFTEALGDAAFRPAPITTIDAREMISEIRGQNILAQLRGLPAVDIDALIQCLMVMNDLALDREEILAIDVNPLIIRGNRPVGVDALVIMR